MTIRYTASPGLRLDGASASQGSCTVANNVATCELGTVTATGVSGPFPATRIAFTFTQSGLQSYEFEECGAQTGCSAPSIRSFFVAEGQPPPPPPPVNAAPVIQPISPKAGSKTADRTPLIKARIRDDSGELRPRNIKLFVDGKKKAFRYVAGNRDLLRATPRLSLGRHTVKVIATDRFGKRAVKSWRFAIVKKR